MNIGLVFDCFSRIVFFIRILTFFDRISICFSLGIDCYVEQRYTLLHNDYEHKWKAERDRAFTELKRKERDLEKEKSKREAEKRVEERNRLEEEVKRKDREVKERIEAMHKNLKSVKELDDPKTDQKKDDKNKTSPKSSIRLNLTSSKSSPESSDKTKSSEKSSDKRDKPIDKSKEKSEERLKKLEKTDIESMDTSEDIGDIVIDEINCEDNNENKSSKDIIIDEIVLLSPEVSGNNQKNDSKPDETQETNITEIRDKTEENDVQVLDSSVEEVPKEVTEDNTTSPAIENEISGKTDDNSNQIEGVLPGTTANSDSNAVTSGDPGVSKPVSEPQTQTNEKVDQKTDSEDKTTDEVINKPEDNAINEGNVEPKQVFTEGCADNPAMTYAQVVAKGSATQESGDSDLKSAKSVDIPPENVRRSESHVEDEPKNVKSMDVLDTIRLKAENFFDIDSDIEVFNQRLKNFDESFKKDSLDVEPEEEDPLDGFDVIDETINEDNNRSEDNPKEVIELSDWLTALSLDPICGSTSGDYSWLWFSITSLFVFKII